MAKNATPAQNPATPAQVAATPVGNVAVIDKLSTACEQAASADQFAREAATVAVTTDFLDVTDKAKRVEKILDLYKSSLTHKAVKESFSAAVVVLVNAQEVTVCAASKTEKPNGKLSFGAPEVLEQGEVPNPEKVVTKLAPEQVIAQTDVNLMKQVAKVARDALGIGRATGGGRKAAAPAEPKRAPFFDEFAAVLKDDALRLQAFRLIELAGWKVVPVEKKAK